MEKIIDQTIRRLLITFAVLLASVSVQAGEIDFSDLCCGSAGTSLERTIVGTGESVGVTATFNNPFTEQSTDLLYYNNGLVLGSGGLTLSWDVTFSEAVSLTSISISNPIITNLGFNVIGPGINESALLAGQGAGNYLLTNPLMMQGNTAYTFSAVNRNVTSPITTAGGLTFVSWTFGEVSEGNVPAPATLVLLGLGLASIGFQRRKHNAAA